MTQHPPPARLTRRRLLAGIGAGGLVLGAGRAVGHEPTHPYTHYTYAATDSQTVDVRIGWYETYNGHLVERHPTTLVLDDETASSWNASAQRGAFADDHTAPVVTLDDVLPGDSGTLVVGLYSENAPASVWVQLDAGAFEENGQTEPESRVDATPAEGELGDALHLAFWYDTGLAGFGACNGTRDLTEPPVVPAGSLRQVASRLDGGVALASADSATPVDCLDRSEPLCLGLSWSLDPTVGNGVQSDSVTFDLTFAAVDCGVDANPFAEGDQ